MAHTQRATIVLIDDDHSHLRLLSALLKGAGYQVRAFRESQSALENVDRDRPDLVLTDIFMPFVDGFEVLRHVKQRFADLPVVTMTEELGGHGAHYLDVSLKQGASMAFQKPISASNLLEEIHRLIWRDKRSRVGE